MKVSITIVSAAALTNIELIIALRWVLRELLRSTRRARVRVLDSFIDLVVKVDWPAIAITPLLPARFIHGHFFAHLGPERQEDVASLAGPTAARPGDHGRWRAGPSTGATSMDWTASSPSAPRRGT